MGSKFNPSRSFLLLCGILLFAFSTGAQTLRIASFNVENYLDAPLGKRPAKSVSAKAQVRESILAMKPDIIALQEMGTTNALLELREGLKGAGLDFPFWEHVSGFDTNLHLAILSRIPFASRRPHTNTDLLVDGRRLHVNRGFAEVTVQVNPSYKFTLIAAHLKSRRSSSQVDEGEWRAQEAVALRSIINGKLKEDPELNLIVLGDFNDTKDSRVIRTVIGRGKSKLFDTRPAELAEKGEDGGSGKTGSRSRRVEQRGITWTHYFSAEDTYSRFDYIFISQGMKKTWLAGETYVLNLPEWGLASDHRPVVAAFSTSEPDKRAAALQPSP